MTVNHPHRPAAPNQLAARLARLGLPAAGTQPARPPCPTCSRRSLGLLGAFLTETGPPTSA